MKLVVLVEVESWVVTDLRRAARDCGVSLQTASWHALSATIGMEQSSDATMQQIWTQQIRSREIALHDADAVLLRTVGAGSLEQIVFRLDALHSLEGVGIPVINSPSAIEISVDKYRSLSRMAAAGLPVPRTIACQRAQDAMAAFEELGGDVVIKPIFGAEGFGITRVSDTAMAQRAFYQLEQMNSVAYVQEVIDHGGADLRLFVIDGRVVAAMRRCQTGRDRKASNRPAGNRTGDIRTNVALGATTQAIQPDPEIAALAIRAAQTCEAVVAGVDIVLDGSQQPRILEVNASPGWKHLSAVSGIDISAAVLSSIRNRVSSTATSDNRSGDADG